MICPAMELGLHAAAASAHLGVQCGTMICTAAGPAPALTIGRISCPAPTQSRSPAPCITGAAGAAASGPPPHGGLGGPSRGSPRPPVSLDRLKII